MPKQPTARQKRATQLFLENPLKPRTEIIREAGYSSSTALGSSVFNSQGVQAMLKKYNLTEERYFKKIDEALEARKWNDFTGEREPDYRAQLPFHDKLGRVLRLEDQPQGFFQQNNFVVVREEDNGMIAHDQTDSN